MAESNKTLKAIWQSDPLLFMHSHKFRFHMDTLSEVRNKSSEIESQAKRLKKTQPSDLSTCHITEALCCHVVLVKHT